MGTQGNDLDNDAPNRASEATILPLVADEGNYRMLERWLDAHDEYASVDHTASLLTVDFDLAIIDNGAFAEHFDALKAAKSKAQPALLPYLLFVDKTDTSLFDLDHSQLGNSGILEIVDDVLSAPVQKAELHWRIESLLRQRRQSLELQETLDGLNDPVFVFEPDGAILSVNQRAVDAYGYSEADFRERSIDDLEPEASAGRVADRFAQIREAGNLVYETVHETGDHERFPVEVSASFGQFRDSPAVVATAREITERKEREAELQRTRRAIDEAPIGIIITDSHQKNNPIIYANEGFLANTGYTRSEVIGRNSRFLQGENTATSSVETIRRAIEEEVEVTVELRNYRKDGTEWWNRLTIAPVEDADGEVSHFVGFQVDVTERKNRERQLQVLARVLRHNLRNDMNVIHGRAEDIKETATGEIAESAARISKQTEKLFGLFEKEQHFAEMLSQPTESHPQDLGTIVRETVRAVQRNHQSARFDVEVPADVSVSAITELDSAIEELLTNAIIHSDRDAPSVTVRVEPGPEAVTVRIADDGPGIPEMERNVMVGGEDIGQLYHGSGLGLWLVYWIVTRSNGTLSFEDNDDRGSVVVLTLPRADGQAA